MSDGQWISLFAMMVSLMAMLIQLVFGVLNFKRAARETDRQIAETKKQEVMHAVSAEETYKAEVRAWGRSVVRAMSRAQQFAKIDPTKFVTSDYDLHRAETVSVLRGLLDKAKWLFPNLAIPSREDEDWREDHKRQLSALETILHAYHVLDTVKAGEKDSRDRSVINIRKLRKQFVREMRRAVDPHVRGEDIERIMAEVHDEHIGIKDQDDAVGSAEPALVIGPGEASVLRK
jgi:hypothetical protein